MLWSLKPHIYYHSQVKSEEEPLKLGEAQMSSNARSLKYLLGWLIAGTRGGPTRAKMIDSFEGNSAER